MLRVLFCLWLVGAVSVIRAALPPFEVEFQTLRIPAITAVQPAGTGELREATILGKLYPEGARPTILAADAVTNPGESPYALVAELLRVAKDGNVDAMRALYSPDSQERTANQYTDPRIRKGLSEWLNSLQSLTVLCGWAEAPNRYILYARSNDGTVNSVTLLLLERLDGRWYLYAGKIDSELSTWLDAVYFSRSEPPIEIISPAAPEAVRALLAQEGMAAFAAELGVTLPQGDLAK